MSHAVRCPECLSWSRVGAEALGQLVACPACGVPFEATPEVAAPAAPRREPVVVQPIRGPRADDGGRFADATAEFDPAHEVAAASPGLLALAVVPFGIPFAWLLAPLVAARPAIFSFAVPVALALGVCGLCVGVRAAAGWSLATRVRAMVMLVLLGYGAAGFLYFLKQEWAVAITRRFPGPPERDWLKWEPPDRSYRVQVPVAPAPQGASPLPGWPLAFFQSSLDGPVKVRYQLAHGSPAEAVDKRTTNDDAWFDAARQALEAATGGQVTREVPVAQQDCVGREYDVTVPDGTTNQVVRVVRIFRHRRANLAYYVAVEGAFLANDARYVRTFFDKFSIQAR